MPFYLALICVSILGWSFFWYSSINRAARVLSLLPYGYATPKASNLSKHQKSIAMPLRSQSPYRTGSGPSRPPSSLGNTTIFAFLRRSSASAKARTASGGSSSFSDKIRSFRFFTLRMTFRRLPSKAKRMQRSWRRKHLRLLK